MKVFVSTIWIIEKRRRRPISLQIPASGLAPQDRPVEYGVGGVRQAKTPPFLVIPLFFCGVSLWVQRSADFHVPGESGIPRYRPLRSAVGSRGNAESGGRRGKTTTLRGHGNIPRSFYDGRSGGRTVQATVCKTVQMGATPIQISNYINFFTNCPVSG